MNQLTKIITICVVILVLVSTPFLLIFAQSDSVVTESSSGSSSYPANSSDVYTHKIYGKTWNTEDNKFTWVKNQSGDQTNYRIALDSAYNDSHGAVIAGAYVSQDGNYTVNGTEYRTPRIFTMADISEGEGETNLFTDDHRWSVKQERIRYVSEILNDTAIIGRKIQYRVVHETRGVWVWNDWEVEDVYTGNLTVKMEYDKPEEGSPWPSEC